MNSNIKLSIIVPVYNVEKYLDECIQSIIFAYRDGIEVILVDDGSKDNSGEICDKYSKEYESMMHKAIKKVTNDIEEMKFNTAVSTFMTMLNEFTKSKKINRAEYKTFLQLLNPFAPHMTEEIWNQIGEEKEISQTPWPIYDEAKTIDDEIEIPVQINGKVKATVVVPKDADESIVEKATTENEAVSKLLEGKNIVKKIYVKGKIYNIVVK